VDEHNPELVFDKTDERTWQMYLGNLVKLRLGMT